MILVIKICEILIVFRCSLDDDENIIEPSIVMDLLKKKVGWDS